MADLLREQQPPVRVSSLVLRQWYVEISIRDAHLCHLYVLYRKAIDPLYQHTRHLMFVTVAYISRRKQDAAQLLLVRVRNCADDAEYHMLTDQWDTINRPAYVRRIWSPRQEEALGAVAFFVALDDEEAKRQHRRCLFVSGGPGSDKSAVLLEVAIRCAMSGLGVLRVREWHARHLGTQSGRA